MAPASGRNPLEPPGPPMRASDADRCATVLRLQDGVARGLLTPDEGSERMATAFAARWVRDLDDLVADLPAAASPGVSAPGWPTLAAMALAQLRATLNGPPGHHGGRVAVALVLTLLVMGLLAVGTAVLDELN